MDHPTHESGLVANVAALVKNGFGLAFNRLELASLEFAEARNHFLKILLMGALGIVGALFAIGFWSALVVVLAWDTMGWKILLVIALFFTLIVFALYRYVASMLEAGKLSLPATMAELRNDRDALF